jgi:hypothetical protein
MSPATRRPLAVALGVAVIALACYAALVMVGVVVALVLLQRGVTPDLPWLRPVQRRAYARLTRATWQRVADCVEFDSVLIYRPRVGTCHFANLEYRTSLTFSAHGRDTGPRPAGRGIAVLGDSHAMGWGVQDLETFAAELQRRTGRPVYNLGVSSYATERELERWRLTGLADSVDTVVLQYSENDLPENRHGRLGTAESNRRKFDYNLVGRAQPLRVTAEILRVWLYAFGRPFTAPLRGLLHRGGDDFTPHLAPLVDVLERYPELRDERVIVTYLNSRGRRYRNFPAGRLPALPHVEFLELAPVPGGYYVLDDHMNPVGHAAVAAQLAAAVAPR